MELRDFAQQVLFGTTLEQKLHFPAEISDERPGEPLAAPESPGRPVELRFKTPGAGQADVPPRHRLDQERERGRLLHFFANHELLATELMALVLLRFPNAPAAFRRGVFQTLKDEQLHTRLYLQRMKECGIHFGELPVSGYFWRAVSPMESPIDYVAGLSLTFEQANLDFCRYFAHAFQDVGDTATATLLERIGRDEIGHVASGLKWFRRWKEPQQSDWEAFCQQLKFPLSPQRAKGLAFNAEARRAAGLEPAFIAELNVYSQSKGRTPSVFVFNPFAEGYIAYGKAFTPVKQQQMLAEDLANLPQFLCRQDDVVLVEKRPGVEFLSAIKQAGFALPEFAELHQQAIEPASSLCQRKISRLRPWAWGPDSVELLGPLFGNCTGDKRTAKECFNNTLAQLYSKAWSAAFLRKVLSRWAGEPWLCSEREIGVPVESLGHALETIAAIRTRGHHKIGAKEAFGLAGHNAIRLWEPEILETQRRWLARALENGRKLVIEPWLEREIDFSVQFEMGPAGLKLCGYTGLINDRKGQFQANSASPNCERRIPSNVAALVGQASRLPTGRLAREVQNRSSVAGLAGETPAPLSAGGTPALLAHRLERLYGDIRLLLEDELHRAGYLGPVGIDSFVYRAAQGECRVKPVVEINPRYTMGRLTLALMKQTCPGSHGLFRLVSRAMMRAEGLDSFADYACGLADRFPLVLEGEPVRKIREGALCLNDPARAQVCLALFQVSRSAGEGGGHCH